MKKLRQKLLACVALGLMATPAHAVSVGFDFTGGAFGALTDTHNYTDTGLTLQITASILYLRDTEYTTDSSVKIGQYGQYGLGVVNSQDYSNFRNNQPLVIDGQYGTGRLNLYLTKQWN